KQSRPPQPVRLQSQLKRSTEEGGGHRTASPEETFERYKHHISPITGIVSSFISKEETSYGLTHNYATGHSFPMLSNNMLQLRANMRYRSGGKGTTEIQAKTSALCEAIERYSGVYWGDEYCVRGTYNSLQPEALHIRECMLFSDAQYANRAAWNAACTSTYHIVPDPFADDLEVDWTPIWSLTHNRWRYLPTAYCYFGHPELHQFFCTSDTNGSAAGNSVEEAILQGFMELVERDAVAVWWYNRIPRPAVDLDSFGLPYLDKLRAHYAEMCRDIWVLDITNDLGIPAFAAVSRRTDRPVEDILIGSSAHLDPRTALLRAVTELNQFLPAVSHSAEDGSTLYWFDEQDAVQWWKTATIASEPYVAPHPSEPLRKLADYPRLTSNDMRDDVCTCVDITRSLGWKCSCWTRPAPTLACQSSRWSCPASAISGGA
ncbi:MAG: YcaO-like family protein, partial [Chloroflexi bacterium]|nr:YcaO-like family protein [Chloroflexota bacterium]